MSELYFIGIEIGMSKQASWQSALSGALGGAGLGGVAGAIASDPGARMRGFMRGAAIGGLAGGVGGGLMGRRAMTQFAESGAHKGLNAQNVGQAMRNPQAFGKVTGMGDDAAHAIAHRRKLRRVAEDEDRLAEA